MVRVSGFMFHVSQLLVHGSCFMVQVPWFMVQISPDSWLLAHGSWLVAHASLNLTMPRQPIDTAHGLWLIQASLMVHGVMAQHCCWLMPNAPHKPRANGYEA